MRKLKKILFLPVTVILLSLSHPAISQSLYFCEEVDDNGHPKNQSNTFIISKKGGYLDFLVRLDEEISTSNINFDIYKIDFTGKERFYKMMKQTTQHDSVWFYKQMTFYEAGNFKVYVYDEDKELLASGKLKIKFQ